MKIEGQLVTVDGTMKPIEIDSDSARGLQQAVGGYIEALRLSKSLVMWANEDGMYTKPVNLVATYMVAIIAAQLGLGQLRQEFHGDVVFTGQNPPRTTALTDEHLRLVQSSFEQAKSVLAQRSNQSQQ